MRFEKQQHTASGHVARGVTLLFVLIATILATPVALRGQQPAPTSALAASTRADEDRTIRPFVIKVPEEALVDLRRRLAMTRWPDQETIADRSQGIQLANLREIVRTGRPATREQPELFSAELRAAFRSLRPSTEQSR